jgi:tRNA (guanosine-2'-O-)-methyltransferase
MGSYYLSSSWPNKVQILEKDYDIDLIINSFEFLLTESRREKINRIVQLRSSSLIPVLENIYDRGNISAVMRSAESFGFFNFHIIDSVSQFKESARVTQGADKWLNVKKWKSTEQGLAHLKDQGVRIYTTALTENAVEIQDLDFSSPVALVLGNEKDGVSKAALDMSDGNVLIPMVGFTQSFNISVAAALCFQEARKKATVVTELEAKALKASYILNSLQITQDRMMQVLKPTTLD